MPTSSKHNAISADVVSKEQKKALMTRIQMEAFHTKCMRPSTGYEKLPHMRDDWRGVEAWNAFAKIESGAKMFKPLTASYKLFQENKNLLSKPLESEYVKVDYDEDEEYEKVEMAEAETDEWEHV